MIASNYQGRQKSKDLVNSLVWSWEIAWRPTLYIWSDLQTLTLWTKECWEGPKYFSIIRQITVPRLTGPNTFQFFRRWVSSKHHAGSLAPPIWCLSWLNYHPSMGRDRHGDIRKIFTLWEGGGGGMMGRPIVFLLIYIRHALQLGLAGFWPQVEFWQLN